MTGYAHAERLRPREDHPEILDDRSLDPAVVERSMRDVALSNALFGGAQAVLREIQPVLATLRHTATLVDVGTGLGDIPAAAQRSARARGINLFTVGVEPSMVLVASSRRVLNAVVVADAAALPFRDDGADVVTCSQVLHHFADDSAAAIVREMNRVARHRAIVSDIRRSRVAALGLWLASFALRFHPVSRHDGVASIRRGYRAHELRSLVNRAIAVSPAVRLHRGFRVTASWSPGVSFSEPT